MTRRKAGMLLVCAILLLFTAAFAAAAELTPLERLGKRLFNDPSLSNPPGQSCADCHAAETGWTGPDSAINAAGAVFAGAVHTRFGNRKPPTVAYAGSTPLLQKCGGMGDCSGGMGGGMGGGGMGGGGMGGGGMGGGGMGGGGMGGGMMDRTFVGGLFWDGRATGWILGDPLAEQAQGPFLNPLEQNNPNAKHVCLNLQRTDYAVLFEEVWGAGSLDCVKDVKGSYERIARSIAAYERSAEVNPFSSKFDNFWRNSTGKMPPVSAINSMNWNRFRNRGLDDTELKGLALFNSKGMCSSCHLLTPGPGNTPPLFVDFSYHNLGLPKNPENPFYDLPPAWNREGENWVDLGLGGFLTKTAGVKDLNGTSRNYVGEVARNLGRHRTPTLRNVDKRPNAAFVKAYGHNGYFKSLQEIVHFYNLRDVLPVCTVPDPPKDAMGGATCFPAPELDQNVNRMQMGNLGLTPAEGMALIRFLQTLSDGYSAE